MSRVIRIATRQSPLALAQAAWLETRLQACGYQTVLCPMTSLGDQRCEAPLSSLGENKGSFCAKLDQAVLQGEADVAVHSLKDWPTIIPEGLMLATVSARQDPRDAYIGPSFQANHQIGTSSARRQSLCQALYRDAKIVPIRGNVQTRLSQIGEQVDAVILAMAGLQRLGLDVQATPLDPKIFVPAAAQGVIGVVCQTTFKHQQILAALSHPHVMLCVQVERAIVRALGAQCQSAVGVHMTIDKGEAALSAYVGSTTSTAVCRVEKLGPYAQHTTWVSEVVDALYEQGAQRLLDTP